MIGIWTFALSLVVTLFAVAGAVVAFRSGHRVAIVLGLDAALIAGLGLLLNATSSGELTGFDLLLFGVLPLALMSAAVILAFKGRQTDERYILLPRVTPLRSAKR